MIRWLLIFICLVAFALAAACASAPPPPSPASAPVISFSPTQTSDEKKFIVSIRPHTEPAPINRIHSWRITLTTLGGVPVTKATFYVGGGMPEHGHGFPTRPVVSEEPTPGTYLLEGMKFSMHGRWEIKFAIQSGAESDIVTFNTMVALPVFGK